MELVNKLLKEKSKEVSAVLLSAIISLVIYFVYDISIVQLFILYSIQTLILIPMSVIRSLRFSLFQGLIEVFWWVVLLIVFLRIAKAEFGYISYDWISVGNEYFVIIPLYVVLGCISALYGQKVISALELSFLNSLIFRRTGILLLSLIIGLAIMKFTTVTVAVVFFILLQTIFELFILYQSLQFRTAAQQHVLY